MICPTCKGTGEIENEKTEAIQEEKLTGTLSRKYGLNGFKMALPGHPVYDDGNRYVFYLEPENEGQPKRITFYKETLKSWINFS